MKAKIFIVAVMGLVTLTAGVGIANRSATKPVSIKNVTLLEEMLVDNKTTDGNIATREGRGHHGGGGWGRWETYERGGYGRFERYERGRWGRFEGEGRWGRREREGWWWGR